MFFQSPWGPDQMGLISCLQVFLTVGTRTGNGLDNNSLTCPMAELLNFFGITYNICTMENTVQTFISGSID